MSAPTTGAVQRARLRALGLATVELPALRRRRHDRRRAAVVAAAGAAIRFAAALARWSASRRDGARRRGGRPARAPAHDRRSARARAAACRRSPACARPTARCSRCRSTAGSAPADAADAACSRAPHAPVLDIGCGPGRHLAALQASGKRALGVDLSPVAVALARGRGATAMPGVGVRRRAAQPARWRTALLLDGNIGIGGAPVALLRRAARAAAPRRRARSSRSTRRARATRAHAHPDRGRRRGQRVVRLGARRRRRHRARRGARRASRRDVGCAARPHVRGWAAVTAAAAGPVPRRASGARRCAARG